MKLHPFKVLLLTFALTTAACGSEADDQGREPPEPPASPSGTSNETTGFPQGVNPPEGEIAFTQDASDLFVITADGTGLTMLGSDVTQPTWSPDGSRIAGFCGDHQICTMNADGSELEQITSGSKQKAAPAWSPDGTTIAFVIKPGPEVQPQPAHIAVMDEDGSELRELTDGPNYDYRPTWSPDGAMLAFERDFVEGGGGILVMERDGSGLTELVSGPDLLVDPAWSPDGSTIVFWNMGEQALESVDVDSHRVSSLIRAEEIDPDRAAQINSTYPWPAWSPDGEWLVLAGCCDQGSTSLYLIDATGEIVVTIPNGDSATAPAWRPT